VTWLSGFVSIANSLSQFREPLLVLAGFTTLFLLGWILADARIRTRSLWLPIGLHGGWIFASALFNKVARREIELLPWIGRNLLVGIGPLCVALVSWALLRALFNKHVEAAKS
jgi:membrane protease YdiL (CAAX protease family)